MTHDPHTTRATETLTPRNRSQTEISAPVAADHQKGELILVMDDDPDCLVVTQYTLELLGYQCLSTQEAQEVTALAEHHHPDLFLLDIVTPTLGGIELFHQLRRFPQFTDVPIVALTALALEREREQILSAGFDDFLSKPFFLEDLVRLMHRNLPDRQALDQDLQVVEPRSAGRALEPGEDPSLSA